MMCEGEGRAGRGQWQRGERNKWERVEWVRVGVRVRDGASEGEEQMTETHG